MHMNQCLVFVGIILLVGCMDATKSSCSIKDGSAKCRSEMQVYQDSLRLSENNNLSNIPFLIRVLKKDENFKDVNKMKNAGDHLVDDSVCTTWISEHKDNEGMMVGSHYIYWLPYNDKLSNEENNYMQGTALSPE